MNDEKTYILWALIGQKHKNCYNYTANDWLPSIIISVFWGLYNIILFIQFFAIQL